MLNNMYDLIQELYQITFIASTVFIFSIMIDLAVKSYGRFSLHKETKFVLTTSEKILMWISITIFIAYLL